MELAAFYEEQFGRVPLATINAAWFQALLHPLYRPPGPSRKRLFDLTLPSQLLSS